jgi:hypothetical protein
MPTCRYRKRSVNPRQLLRAPSLFRAHAALLAPCAAAPEAIGRNAMPIAYLSFTEGVRLISVETFNEGSQRQNDDRCCIVCGGLVGLL